MTSYAALLSLPLLLPLLWLYLLPPPSTPALKNATITLLIAHPDDEAMFFAPTLLSLSPHNTVKVLCLSTGDADGLGTIRRQELVASCRALGVRTDSDVAVIDDPSSLPDSMSTSWPAGVIASYLSTHAADSDVVITFDAGGVSGHPNHVSLLHGAREFVKSQGEKKRLWTLTSVGLARKYISVLDVPVTALLARRGMVFVSGLEQVRAAQRAMTDAHKSQMRWFRWGWIGLSRYMVVNDLGEDTAGNA